MICKMLGAITLDNEGNKVLYSEDSTCECRHVEFEIKHPYQTDGKGVFQGCHYIIEGRMLVPPKSWDKHGPIPDLELTLHPEQGKPPIKVKMSELKATDGKIVKITSEGIKSEDKPERVEDASGL